MEPSTSNGDVLDISLEEKTSSIAAMNGNLINGFHELTQEELERELPMVYDDQVPLGDALSRVVQAIYAELCELAETMPNMSDATRKRTLADWVVKTKKQVVKLYAVVKWARDADTVQKCMNITAFLMSQNQQFEDAVNALSLAKQNLDPSRLRNHDLLTSLDVLTTGSYRRLPTIIKKLILPPPPLTNAKVEQTLKELEDVIRYRLCMSELVPVEMSQHHIWNGRVTFTVPNLFKVSLCLRGARLNDGWLFLHVEFLITIGGDLTGMEEFPREPTGIIKQQISDEANARLMFYVPLPPEGVLPPEIEAPPRLQLPENVVDAPLVRLFNFLQIMCLSYQLEILWHQSERMRSLGWANFLKVEMKDDRKTLVASYWIRQPPPTVPGRPQPNRLKLPQLGGTLTISIVETHAPPQVGGGPTRSSKARVLAELEQKSKLGCARPSDQVEGLRIDVSWEPAKGALGVVISPEDAVFTPGELFVDANDLDFDALLRKVIEKHITAILKVFQFQLQRGKRTVFSAAGDVNLVMDERVPALRVRLCGDEVVIVAIDPRTGRLSLRDTGDLAAAGRGPRFAVLTERLAENPSLLLDALIGLRLNTIADLAQQKAHYLGLRSFRHRNFSKDQLVQLGPTARGTVYIQLNNFPQHYLVLVITDDEFRYALISVSVVPDSMYGNMIMEDIAWLDLGRIHGADDVVTVKTGQTDPLTDGALLNQKPRTIYDGLRPADVSKVFNPGSFNLETQVLRELYAYCCARVAYTKVEQQLKLRGIPYTHVNPPAGKPPSPELAHIQSSLAHSVPALCVQASHILSGVPAAEAAMSNIRVVPLNWWSEKKAQVVTCVKLKYVQQPMGKTAGTSAIIRPSKRIIYDTTEAVVSFLSEDVDTCVDEFLEEWARVSKMVVIAREVAQMSKKYKWSDVRLLSFDLQTVEFAYAADYTVFITCTDQLSPTGGSFDLRFSRTAIFTDSAAQREHDRFNPHECAEPFLRGVLRQGHGRLAPSLHHLVSLLRDTLPIVVELDAIRAGETRRGRERGREREGQEEVCRVDTFAKAAGWYRVLYGDLRHALDFRLMKGQRVAILDASYSLFGTRVSSASITDSPKVIQLHQSIGTHDEKLGLRPIPRFREIVREVVVEVSMSGSVPSSSQADWVVRERIVPVDVGVVCETGAVRAVARALHLKVAKELQEVT